jgi:hypothetical protein
VFVAGKREVAAAKTGRSLSPEAKFILGNWFAENYTRYPSPEEKLHLAQGVPHHEAGETEVPITRSAKISAC